MGRESDAVCTFLRFSHAWIAQTFPSPGFIGHPEPYWYTIGDEYIQPQQVKQWGGSVGASEKHAVLTNIC